MVAVAACQFSCPEVFAQPASTATAEQDFMVGDGIAEFVPPFYDASKTPSLALVSEPKRAGDLAATFAVRPDFETESNSAGPDFFPQGASLSEAIVNAPAGTCFYGTGEVTGPLLRNNTTIELWNTDNYNWKKAGGARLYQSHPWVLAVRPDGTSFGVLFDTTWKSRLTCGDHDIHFESQGPPFRVFVINRSSPRLSCAALPS